MNIFGLKCHSHSFWRAKKFYLWSNVKISQILNTSHGLGNKTLVKLVIRSVIYEAMYKFLKLSIQALIWRTRLWLKARKGIQSLWDWVKEELIEMLLILHVFFCYTSMYFCWLWGSPSFSFSSIICWMRNRKYDEDDQKQKQIQQIRAKKNLRMRSLLGGVTAR